jgi:hypothetical protein
MSIRTKDQVAAAVFEMAGEPEYGAAKPADQTKWVLDQMQWIRKKSLSKDDYTTINTTYANWAFAKAEAEAAGAGAGGAAGAAGAAAAAAAAAAPAPAAAAAVAAAAAPNEDGHVKILNAIQALSSNTEDKLNAVKKQLTDQNTELVKRTHAMEGQLKTHSDAIRHNTTYIESVERRTERTERRHRLMVKFIQQMGAQRFLGAPPTGTHPQIQGGPSTASNPVRFGAVSAGASSAGSYSTRHVAQALGAASSPAVVVGGNPLARLPAMVQKHAMTLDPANQVHFAQIYMAIEQEQQQNKLWDTLLQDLNAEEEEEEEEVQRPNKRVCGQGSFSSQFIASAKEVLNGTLQVVQGRTTKPAAKPANRAATSAAKPVAKPANRAASFAGSRRSNGKEPVFNVDAGGTESEEDEDFVQDDGRR